MVTKPAWGISGIAKHASLQRVLTSHFQLHYTHMTVMIIDIHVINYMVSLEFILTDIW